MDYWIIFLTGLTTGGLTCLAVQSGLLASCIAQRKQEEIYDAYYGGYPQVFAIIAFLLTKLIAYTLLGALLGYLGSVVQLSLKVQATMQFVAGLFILAAAGNMLNLHPIFRYFTLQPPHFVTRLVRNEAKSRALFAPAILGFMTVLIPCGTTQAMMALAVTSGFPFVGAMILFLFTLGTMPIFFGIFYFATKLGDHFSRVFSRVAAIAVLVLGILTVNTSLNLWGSTYTLNDLYQKITESLSQPSSVAIPTIPPPVVGNAQGDTVQEFTIHVESTSYNPNTLTTRAGVPVTLHLVTNGVRGCARAFTIPKFGIRKVLPETGNESVEFTPTEPGQIRFTCSMGMYTGIIKVI